MNFLEIQQDSVCDQQFYVELCSKKKDRFLAKILSGDKAVHDSMNVFAIFVLSYVAAFTWCMVPKQLMLDSRNSQVPKYLLFFFNSKHFC